MIEKIERLKKKVGTPYRMFFPNSTDYLGCFFPLYEIFPSLKKYPLPSEDHTKNFRYGISKIRKHFVEIREEELQAGDVIACEFNDELHVALYIGKHNIIHVFRGHSLQINKITMINKEKIAGYFRGKYEIL